MKAAWAKDVIRMVVIGLAGFTGTASAVGPQGTYTDWWLPNLPAEGFFTIDGYITPVNEPTVGPGQVQFAYFYSSQFGIVDGDGGYIGIQTDGNGKRAIFSIWGANGAQCADVAGAICQPFTGEGDGYQTLVPYEWVPGHRYRTRVWALDSDADGDWWVGEVADLTAGTAQVVGYIRVPPVYQWLKSYIINWVEWYAPQAETCDQLPESAVLFGRPDGNAGGVSAGEPNNHYGTGVCPSQIYMVNGQAMHRNGRDRIFTGGFEG
jgi:hypothetical protein